MTRRLGKVIGLFTLALPLAVGAAQSTRPSAEYTAELQRPQVDVPPAIPGIGTSEAGERETLRVFTQKSLIVNSADPLKRASVTDPAVASAMIISPRQILIHGLKPGSVTLLLWDQEERVRSFNLHVLMDTGSLTETLQQLFPGEDIQVSPSGNALVLSGAVSSPEVAARAEALAKTEAGAVVNMLHTPQMSDASLQSLRKALQQLFPGENMHVNLSGGALVLSGTASSAEVAARAETLAKTEAKEVVNLVGVARPSDVVLLQCRFAEVQRAAVQQLGMHLLSTGATNSLGAVTTQQFGQIGAMVGALPEDIEKSGQPPGANQLGGATGKATGPQPGRFGLSDILNIFLFRPDVDLGIAIRALEQRNLLQILAEPNLLALSGKEASFLAGGEFPFPVVQAGAITTVSIVFKEFGVRLKFTATTLADDTIHLKVGMEDSSLDFANALTLSGFLVPAISTRRAETEVELANGQSFAIAGLIDNRMAEIASKIPGLGDIPILGKLFRSRALNRNNSELLVLVTPKLVKALTPDQLPPDPGFPAPFLDKDRFDGKAGETPARDTGKP